MVSADDTHGTVIPANTSVGITTPAYIRRWHGFAFVPDPLQSLDGVHFWHSFWGARKHVGNSGKCGGQRVWRGGQRVCRGGQRAWRGGQRAWRGGQQFASSSSPAARKHHTLPHIQTRQRSQSCTPAPDPLTPQGSTPQTCLLCGLSLESCALRWSQSGLPSRHI